MATTDPATDTMTAHDWEQVRAIYLEGIATGDATFEQEAPAWEKWDAAHFTERDAQAKADEASL